MLCAAWSWGWCLCYTWYYYLIVQAYTRLTCVFQGLQDDACIA